uniref:Integrase catalytic domain-containing protein n=1 Tax=Strongyloides papillosus TaxID=174720 RepID=A0A0N5BED5_STREA
MATALSNYLSFTLCTDASGDAIGSVLLQNHKVVGFYSRTLKGAERNYVALDLEALAILSSLKHFKVLLYGLPITIITDHKLLTSLLTKKDLSARLTRWMIQLQAFQLNIVYSPGKENYVADCLCRCIQPEPISPQDDVEEFPEEHIIAIETTTAIMNKRFIAYQLPSLIQNIIRLCSICQITYQKRSKTHNWKECTKPLQRGHLDIGHCPLYKSDFFVLKDSFSNFLFADWIPKQDASTICNKLQRIFELTGAWSELVLDNQTSLAGNHMRQFLSSFGTKNTLSIVKQHNTNGAAERAIRSIKDQLYKEKTLGNGKEMTLRNTLTRLRCNPVENNDDSAQNLTTIIDNMFYDFIVNNPATDKCYLSVLKLVENLAEVSKSFNLLFALKDSFLKKEILNKNMELNTKKINQFNFEMCGPSRNICKKQKLINKKSEIVYINLKEDIEQYLTKINGSSLIKDTCIDAILYVDDLNPNRDISSHSKNSAITNMAYRLVLNKNDFEKPSNYQSKLFHFRPFALCFQKISKLSKYKNVITFMMEEFKNLKVGLNDGRIIRVNVHSFIGMFTK